MLRPRHGPTFDPIVWMRSRNALSSATAEEETVLKTIAVSTALLALAAGLLAQQPAITRTVLQQLDISAPGREVVTVKVDFPMGASPGRHTHPGEEVTYVLDGTLQLEIDGAPPKTVKAGE